MTHTWAVSYAFLDHILGLFEDKTKNIRLGFDEEVLDTLLDFIGTPVEELVTMEWTDDEDVVHKLTKPNIRLLQNIHAWILWEERNCPGLDYMTVTMEDFDHFLLVRNLPESNTPTASPTPTAPMQVTIPTLLQTPTVVQSGSFLIMVQPVATFMPNVKLDVKHYPVYNGDGSSWIEFKRNVLSIASTHGLDDVFDQHRSLPADGDPDFSMFKQKNCFVYSIWMSRISGGMALSILREFEDTRDGRGAYLKFLNVFEGKQNIK